MCTRAYLREYLESIEGVPQRLSDLMLEIEDADRQCHQLNKKIDKTQDVIAKLANKNSMDTRLVGKMNEYFDTMIALNKEKIAKASEVYELVDSQIQRLDADLARFDHQVRSNKECYVGDEVDGESGSLKRDVSSAARKNPPPISSMALALEEPQQLVDMPVDPDEPTYCSCNNFSYGEMIGCDNPECSIEWYHFECVGLKRKPAGKWYCPSCSKNRRK